MPILKSGPPGQCRFTYIRRCSDAHPGTAGLHRKDREGAHVLIVDDVVTYGSTLANLRGWLERQGAVVVGAPTLAAGFGGTKLALPDIVRERLSGRFPG
jgi:adenine/guanine phosphoribosyltransferase-like PRPP-binding protein